jgi:hypothetical protein
MDSALATSSVDAARVAAGIAYLAGKAAEPARGVHALLKCCKAAICAARPAAVNRAPRIVLGLGVRSDSDDADANSQVNSKNLIAAPGFAVILR